MHVEVGLLCFSVRTYRTGACSLHVLSLVVCVYLSPTHAFAVSVSCPVSNQPTKDIGHAKSW